eukprot:13550446-Ditylum_brightwellii.AAC.1
MGYLHLGSSEVAVWRRALKNMLDLDAIHIGAGPADVFTLLVDAGGRRDDSRWGQKRLRGG